MATETKTRRTFTVSFPTKLADQVERMAQDESRTMSELFREAFRSYQAQRVNEALAAFRKNAANKNPNGYGPEDVEQLVDEVRGEIAEEKRLAAATR